LAPAGPALQQLHSIARRRKSHSPESAEPSAQQQQYRPPFYYLQQQLSATKEEANVNKPDRRSRATSASSAQRHSIGSSAVYSSEITLNDGDTSFMLLSDGNDTDPDEEE